MYWYDNKSLQIPKRYSEALYQRRTDNAMAKEKKIKRQAMIFKTLHRKLKIEHHEPTKTQ
jgi:hypothetical protein